MDLVGLVFAKTVAPVLFINTDNIPSKFIIGSIPMGAGTIMV